MKPCPFCGGYAQLRHGKKYMVTSQSYHDDTEFRLPASISCNNCNVSVSLSVDISNYPDINAAFMAVAEKVSEKWNIRTDERIVKLEALDKAYSVFIDEGICTGLQAMQKYISELKAGK